MRFPVLASWFGFAPRYAGRNERTSCVCGAARAEIPRRLWRVSNKTADLIYPQYFYRCPECQSFSAVNLYFPVEKYAEMSLDAMHIDATKRALNAARVAWIAQHAILPDQSIIFDLGAGEGCFSHVVATAHPQALVFAVEADARVEDKFYRTNDRVIFVPTYIEPFLAQPPDVVAGRRPDLVVLTDVLEHVLAPEQLLEAVAAALAPGGLAYLTVPDANTFQAPYPYPADPKNIVWAQANRTCQHLWMMQPATFTRLVAAHLDIVAQSQTLETEIRRDSAYTTILARKRG